VIAGIPETATAEISHTVLITFAAGHPVSYKIDSAQAVTIDPAATTNAYSLVIGDLIPGDYTISETAPTNGMILKEATGGKNVNENVVTVTVTAGDTTPTADAAKASFTNDCVLIHILKVTAGTDDPLTGATFKLMKRDGEEYKDYGNPAEKSVDDQGKADFNGLADGTYQLVETHAPAGYVMLSAPIGFTVTNGVVAYTGTDSTVTYNRETKTFTIGNTPGVELPATGGRGTLVFTVSGLALMMLAGVLMISRKRRYNR